MKPRVLLWFLVFCPGLLIAQQPAPPQLQAPDAIGEALFPPELVMQHQQELGLTTEQRNFIRTELQKTQPRLIDLQFQLHDEVETMASLLKQDRVDEQRVLAQLDKVLNQEREIKRQHISLLLRIKNQLSTEQQARLREMRGKRTGQ